MKKIILNLFVLSALVVATSCSSDDDNGGGSNAPQELVMTVDGQTLTFDSVVVDEETYMEDGFEYTEIDVTATIGGNTNRVIEFGLESGDTGADAVYYFDYNENGVDYYYNFDSNFNIVVSANDGSNITATFSGVLNGYNFETDEQETITIENGSISIDY